MSQSGKLIFYTLKHLDAPRSALRTILNFLQPKCVPVISRISGEDHSWNNFLADSNNSEIEILPSLVGAEGLDELYRDNSVLSAQPAGSPVSLVIARAVEAKISKEIRGDHVPCDPFIRIGWHDLWECSEHQEGLFIARPFLSIGFFGYSAPSNWVAFRRAILGVPEIQKIKIDLEQAVGCKLEQTIYWST